MSGKFIFSLSNKMIGKGRKILKPLLSLFLVSFFIFTSCIIDCDEPDTSFQSIENSTSSSSSISSSSELPVSNEAIPQKAILKIGFADDNSARTVLPKVQLSNYVLKGSLAGGANVVLATADTKEEMKTKEIELDPGVWSFTLSADMTGTSVLASVKSYSDTQAVTLIGNPVTVNFDLKPRDSNGTEITKGAVSISLTLSSDVISANKARASLKLGGVEKASKKDDVSAGGTFTFTAENLDKDTYDLEIEFYSYDGTERPLEDSKVNQNTWQALVRIEPGLLSSAEVTGFNLNEVYNITYENVGDAVPDPAAASGIAIKSFSRKSASFELPKYKKSGYRFAGWYDNADFEGSSITGFNPANASSDVTFYAKWVSTTIYVKQGATGSGESPDNAVGNFSAAFDVMKEFKTLSETANDFIIKICGQVDGNQSLPTGLTDAIATSVTIKGNTGLDAAGVPENSLYGKKTGTVLTISTTVPVIIQNLKIYGGSGSKGGGIYMGSGTNVTLDSGALIGDEKQEVATSSDYGNKASSGGGGGICNEGGNLVLNSGSKVCHNYDGSSSYNGGQGGGGIKCSGGSISIDGAVISYNKTTTRGGGIDIAKGSSSASLTMYSGEISHNETIGWGGGVMMHTDNTSFEMIGGKISNNVQSGTASNWAPNGAAIFMDGGSFTMRSDAEISYNEAKFEHGGIVFVGETCKVYLYGGLIKNNKAARGNGSAVAMGGNPTVFEMSGSIYIPYDSDNNQNDVEISNGKVIKITGELDTPVSKPIATLHPGSYARGRTIFEAASPVTDLSAYQDYFAFKVAGWKTKLSDDKTKLMLDSPFYVAGQNPTICSSAGSASGDGSQGNPFDTIDKAVAAIANLDDAASTDYTILIDGELKATLNDPDEAAIGQKINSDMPIHSLTIKGANGLNTTGEPKDIINGQADDTHRDRGLTFTTNLIPVTIECLKITGGLEDQGGGIYLSSGSKLTLGDNVLVTGNTANNSGGGIALLSGSTLIVKDSATIANNRALGATGKGGAVFVGSGSSITISDSVYIPYGFRDPSGIGYTGAGCNDIYLDTEKTVKIGGALSRHSSTDKIRINLPNSAYKLKTKVLELVSSPSPATSLADEYEKFALVNENFVIKATGLTGYSETITSFYVSADGRDDNLGKTEASAYKTIANALKRITGQESAEDYTINIIGTLTGAQTIPASDTSDPEYPITLNADTVKTLTLCGVGSDAKLDGRFDSGNKGTTLTISTPQKVTIKDLTITGGYSDGKGGGIYIDENADVHISEGTKVIQNTACDGAGIYLYKAKLTMSGGIINKNVAEIYKSGFYQGSGGGIYLTGEGAKLLIYGNSFIGEDVAELPTDTSYGNKAHDYSGGIYCNHGGSVILGYSSYESENDNTPAEFTGKICRNYAGSDSTSHAGGIGSNGSVIIASGTISYNWGTAISLGSDGSLKMTGGSIEYNYSSNGNDDAAGIYITESADATITGAKINNNTGVKAGGIYLNSGSLSLGDDVIITENKARYGGGIYCNSSGLKVRGNVQIFDNIDEAETPNPANVYLYNQSDSRTITVTGALVNSSDSSKTAKIGITSKKNPTLVAPITVTKDYSKYNSVNPGKYFQSDTSSYGVTFDSDEKEARLAQSGGSLIIEPIYEDITISADKTSFSKAAASKVIKFSARGKDSDGNETSLEIGRGTGKVGLSIAAITSHGETVPSDGTYYSLSGNNLTLEDKLPAGNYTVSVTASYKDRTYSASFPVKINKALSASEAIATISAMTSSGKIAVAGATTEDEIKSIATAVSNLSSSVKITLDLSGITGLTRLPDRSSSKGLFEECSALEGITLPAGVTVSGGIFKECHNLIYIKGGLNPANASGIVWNCPSLKYIVFPVSFDIFPTNFLYGCNSFTTVYYMGTEAQWNAIAAEEKSPFTGKTIVYNSSGPSD